MKLALPDVGVPDRVSMNPPLAPGELRVIADFEGAGCIKQMFMVVGGHPKASINQRFPNYKRTEMANRKMILRIFFDGHPVPYVECPVGDFFGVMHGQDWYPIDNHYLSVKAWNGLNCFFHMPFANGCRIEVQNGDEPNHIITTIDWERYPDQEMKETRRFCARWRREMPTQRYGEDFLMVDADGPGQLVGFVYGVRLLDDADRWSHGGADNIYVDGDGDHPAYMRGIGGEDTFGEGYGGCLHPPETHHFTAMPYYVHEDVSDSRVAQRVVGYRFFDNDQIKFKKSLHFRFGCMANDICGTVYWYSEKPVRPFAPMPAWRQLLPGVELKREAGGITLPTTGDWMLSGPYGNDKNRAMTTTLAAEGSFDPTAVYDGMHEEGSFFLTDTNKGIGRDVARWVRRSANHNFIDFNHVFRPFAWGVGVTYPGVAVARCILNAPKAMTATLKLSWDDQLKLTVNGQSLDLGRNKYFRSREVKVQLDKGANTVVVKLSNERGSNHGGWVYAFSAAGEDGAILTPEAPTAGAGKA